jgi:hypothetical protein
VALVALALVSGGSAVRPGAAARTGDNDVLQIFHARQMLAAVVQAASRSVQADGVGQQGTRSSLQYLQRQATSTCIPEVGDLENCLGSCEKPTCSGSGCNVINISCTLPGCCASATKSGDRTVITVCYNGCCIAVDEDRNIASGSPCTPSSKTAAATPGTSASTSAPPRNGGTASGAAPSKSPTATSPNASPVPGSNVSPVMSPAASTSKVSSSSCFAGHALVELESGMHRRMDQLLIGDRVKVAQRTFSDVFMFTHKLHNVVATFVVIRTASGHSISLTPGHYIYVNGVLTPAASVKIGDEFELSTGGRTIVVSVSEAAQTGLFNPQTLHGDIFVNGILASTYTTAISPVIGHAWLTPLRMLYSALGSTTGLLENGAEFAASLLPSGLATYGVDSTRR